MPDQQQDPHQPADQPAAAGLEVRPRPGRTRRTPRWSSAAVDVAVPDLLGDHREPEQPEHLVEAPPLRGHREAHPRRSSARRSRRGSTSPAAFVGWRRNLWKNSSSPGLDPVGQRAAEVHQRVADRRHLPVEHADRSAAGRPARAPGCRTGSRCGSAGAPTSAGWLLVEPGGDVGPVAGVVGAGPGEPVGPARDLTRDVPRPRPERREARAPRRRPSAGRRGRRRRARTASRRRAAATPERQVAAQDGAVEPLHHVEVRADHRLVGAEARPWWAPGEDRLRARPGCRYSRRMSWALLAFAPAGGRRRIRSRAPGSAAGRSGSRRRPENCRTSGVPTRSARNGRRVLAQPGRDRLDVERVLLAHRAGSGSPRRSAIGHRASCSLAAWARITASYAARSSCLSSHALRAALVGEDQLGPGVEPLEHGRRDVVARSAATPRPAARRPLPTSGVGALAWSPSGWSGSTTGRRRAARTPYAASSWPVVSVTATTAALTAL